MFSSGSQRIRIYGRRGQGKSLAGLLLGGGCFPAGRVGTAEGSPDDPLLPRLQPDPALPRVLGTCPTQRCFQHLRLGAQPLLHSRKIFVQGLGTRRGGNKSHLGVERAALLRLLCLPLQVASQALRPAVPGPGPGIPLHRRAWGASYSCIPHSVPAVICQPSQQTVTKPTMCLAQCRALDAVGEPGPALTSRLLRASEAGWPVGRP